MSKNIFWGTYQQRNTKEDGNCPAKRPDPHVGLRHHTSLQTDIHTDIQLMSSYTISSAPNMAYSIPTLKPWILSLQALCCSASKWAFVDIMYTTCIVVYNKTST